MVDPAYPCACEFICPALLLPKTGDLAFALFESLADCRNLIHGMHFQASLCDMNLDWCEPLSSCGPFHDLRFPSRFLFRVLGESRSRWPSPRQEARSNDQTSRLLSRVPLAFLKLFAPGVSVVGAEIFSFFPSLHCDQVAVCIYCAACDCIVPLSSNSMETERSTLSSQVLGFLSPHSMKGILNLALALQ